MRLTLSDFFNFQFIKTTFSISRTAQPIYPGSHSDFRTNSRFGPVRNQPFWNSPFMDSVPIFIGVSVTDSYFAKGSDL